MSNDFWPVILGGIAGGVAGPLSTMLIQNLQKRKSPKLIPIEKEILVRAYLNAGEIDVFNIGQSRYGMININNWRPFDPNNETIQENAINGLKHLVDLSLAIKHDDKNFELTFEGKKLAKKLITKGYKIS